MIVKQADHLLTLLELFSEEKKPMTLTQVSEALGLPKSSTHNLIETLAARGYLYEVRARGGFYPSRKLLSLADTIAAGDPVTSLVQVFLEKIAVETGETALLAARARNNVIYLAVYESRQSVRYSAAVGDQRPVYATSGGKAILSSYTGTQLEKELDGITFPGDAAAAPKARATLKANILEGRARGYFLNLSEYTPDVTGVGIPINIEGRTLGFSVAGPNYRMHGKFPELAEILNKTALETIHALKAAGLSASVFMPPSLVK